MTTRRTLAVVAASALVGLAHASVTLDVPPACHTVDVGEASWDLARDLLESGYRGDPTDGAERLYSPHCALDVESAGQMTGEVR